MQERRELRRLLLLRFVRSRSIFLRRRVPGHQNICKQTAAAAVTWRWWWITCTASIVYYCVPVLFICVVCCTNHSQHTTTTSYDCTMISISYHTAAQLILFVKSQRIDHRKNCVCAVSYVPQQDVLVWVVSSNKSIIVYIISYHSRALVGFLFFVPRRGGVLLNFSRSNQSTNRRGACFAIIILQQQQQQSHACVRAWNSCIACMCTYECTYVCAAFHWMTQAAASSSVLRHHTNNTNYLSINALWVSL